MQLIIVESPTKAKKLGSYLGAKYQIEASVGHVRDLPKSGLGIDVDNDFAPTYELAKDKQKVIAHLVAAAKKADSIILATDPDREGEAIAWHLAEILKQKKAATNANMTRATFHEITKSAVLKAIAHPSQIDLHLVNAQQARRVVDRLVGYQVSPVLWKKIRRGLSAGRVQSVALRLIVDRESEISAFVPDEYWEVFVGLGTEAPDQLTALFVDGSPIETMPTGTFITQLITLNDKKFTPKVAQDVQFVGEHLESAKYEVAQIERKKRTRQSVPPFSTSTLQQAASTRFGYSSKNTMRLAQQLYEEGLITYHRTDAISLSQNAMQMARAYISATFGDAYLPPKPRQFATKTKNAQEAHEAIRVTDVQMTGDTLLEKHARFSPQHVKLYSLIWQRFLASQMEAAVYDQTTVTINAHMPEDNRATLRATGSVLKFDGWMRLGAAREDTILPELTEGQPISFWDKALLQKFTQPPPRYNDASLVKELELRGIGRPSTYASIISVIEDRGYVERQDKRFVASAVGMTVTDFLVANFSTFMEYAFTAEMEEDLDRISRGEKEWQAVVAQFYGPFHTRVETVTDTAERMQIPVEKTGEECPECHEGEVVVRTGRFGKFHSCSRFPECSYTSNIVETVENVICPLCQQGEVTIKKSRWGKAFFGCGRYPECGWASWKKPEPGETMTQEEWEIQQAAREERKKKFAARKGEKNSEKPVKKTTKAKKPTTKKTSKTPVKSSPS